METIVIDTNIVFSAVHAANSLTRQMLATLPKRFVTCNFPFVEVFKHKERIFKNSHATDDELYDYLEKVLQKIYFFNGELISTEGYFAAYHLCKDVDLKDILFVTLAIELGAPLWTRGTTLKDAIRAKGFDQFFNETN